MDKVNNNSGLILIIQSNFVFCALGLRSTSNSKSNIYTSVPFVVSAAGYMALPRPLKNPTSFLSKAGSDNF
jgi:uncharacterized membrane protein